MPRGVYPRTPGAPRRTRSLIDRFWDRVQKADGCWLWTGLKNKDGYGRLCSRKGGGRLLTYPTHRLSWEIHFGPVPDGLWVLHRCDNPPCVRPDHLFIGTVADNNADRVAKGRTVTCAMAKPDRIARGERTGRAKLTADQVREIRYRYASGGVSQDALAIEYGVAQTGISCIVRRKSWAHV